jgi:hypothetical protein
MQLITMHFVMSQKSRKQHFPPGLSFTTPPPPTSSPPRFPHLRNSILPHHPQAGFRPWGDDDHLLSGVLLAGDDDKARVDRALSALGVAKDGLVAVPLEGGTAVLSADDVAELQGAAVVVAGLDVGAELGNGAIGGAVQRAQRVVAAVVVDLAVVGVAGGEWVAAVGRGAGGGGVEDHEAAVLRRCNGGLLDHVRFGWVASAAAAERGWWTLTGAAVLEARDVELRRVVAVGAGAGAGAAAGVAVLAAAAVGGGDWGGRGRRGAAVRRWGRGRGRGGSGGRGGGRRRAAVSGWSRGGSRGRGGRGAAVRRWWWWCRNGGTDGGEGQGGETHVCWRCCGVGIERVKCVVIASARCKLLWIGWW